MKKNMLADFVSAIICHIFRMYIFNLLFYPCKNKCYFIALKLKLVHKT
jgi:hypothetical protein